MSQTVGQKKECAIQHQAKEGGSDRLVLREIVFCMFVSSTSELLKGGQLSPWASLHASMVPSE